MFFKWFVIFCAFLLIGNLKVYALDWEKTSLSSLNIKTIEQTSIGVVAGEYDTRLWRNPYNGIYISKNAGTTWEPFGLNGRGITDIKSYEGTLYATTYYYKNSLVGLYYSTDHGATWEHTGPLFSTSAINRDSTTLYLGSYQQGLWISQDEGTTWTQKIGETGAGPEIKAIESSEELTLVSISNKSYKTTDHGNTWTEIVPLKDKTVKKFLIKNNFILAGIAAPDGLYKSTDSGVTWNKITTFGNNEIQTLTTYKEKYFVSAGNRIYETGNIEGIWKDTNIEIPTYNKILDSTWIYAKSPYIFSAISGDGIYRKEIEEKAMELNQFMSPPWEIKNNNELLDKISSFFDHSYPLLGYTYYSEPPEENTTTLNFYGQKETEPTLYYSSHDGIDYALTYGTPIKAVASGYATKYTCTPCGNTIKINHQNGYQTTYMHLQEESLITIDIPVWVDEGTVIGKVGMTGNTTGPHLHFNVKKDDLLLGNTDPYGWQTTRITDPWETFNWNDTFGTHTGIKSSYLWKIINEQTKKFIEQTEVTVLQNNKQIQIPSEYLNINATMFLKPYIQPKLWNLSDNFKYIENTSLFIELIDQLENNINNLNKPVKIVINLDGIDLTEIIQDTLKLYFFNETINEWSPLPTILDLASNTLTSETNHFSKFAVFGEINKTKIKKLKVTGGTFTISQ